MMNKYKRFSKAQLILRKKKLLIRCTAFWLDIFEQDNAAKEIELIHLELEKRFAKENK